jgi:hypothetical protein
MFPKSAVENTERDELGPYEEKTDVFGAIAETTKTRRRGARERATNVEKNQGK